jgi:hypothetical protein
VQTNDRENESQTQHQDDNGVNTQTGALIGVELQHGTGGTTSTSGTSRAGTGISQRLLVVGGGTTAHGSARATGGSGRGGTADGGAGGDSTRASTSGLGLSTGLSTGGERGGGTRRGLCSLLEMGFHSRCFQGGSRKGGGRRSVEGALVEYMDSSKAIEVEGAYHCD